MGMQTIARIGESFEGVFECRHCDLEVSATVYAKAAGTARGTGEHAEEAALERAEMDANAIAARTLQFVKCPRCGARDPSGRGYRIQATLGALVLGALAAGLFSLAIGARSQGRADAGAATWGALGFGVIMALLLYWRWGRPWRAPDARTVFHAPPR